MHGSKTHLWSCLGRVVRLCDHSVRLQWKGTKQKCDGDNVGDEIEKNGGGREASLGEKEKVNKSMVMTMLMIITLKGTRRKPVRRKS